MNSNQILLDNVPYEVNSFADLKARGVFEQFLEIYSRIPPDERISLEVLQDRVENLSGSLGNDVYHLIVMEQESRIVGYSAGRWFSNIDTGFISFLGTDVEKEQKGIGTRVRNKLIEVYHADSSRQGNTLNAVVGEIALENVSYLRRMIKRQDISFLDVDYTQGSYDNMSAGLQYGLYVQIADKNIKYKGKDLFKPIEVTFSDELEMRYAIHVDYVRELIATLYEKIYKTKSSPELLKAMHSLDRFNDYVLPCSLV